MKYKTSAAFRQALEARLLVQSRESNAPLARLRKMVAFDRFLARLVEHNPRAWVIKGGLALQLRLRERARTTRDIDVALLRQKGREEVAVYLRQAASRDLGDWFEFQVAAPTGVVTGAPRGGFRFPIECLLDGRTFERFHLDVGEGDPIVGRLERLSGPELLSFAGLRPARVACYPLGAQVAEKLHAYTRPHVVGESSRVRDLVDILLIASIGRMAARELIRAVRATFLARATHAIPDKLPKPPANWSGPYRRLARELSLNWATVSDAEHAARRFLKPVLEGARVRQWSPTRWAWK